MIIKVKVFPQSDRNDLFYKNDILQIHLTKPARDNKANKAVIELIKKFLKKEMDIHKIQIVKGLKSREKIIEVI